MSDAPESTSPQPLRLRLAPTKAEAASERGAKRKFKLRTGVQGLSSATRHGNGSSVWPTRAERRNSGLTNEEMYQEARDALTKRMQYSKNEMAQVSAAIYVYNQHEGMPGVKQPPAAEGASTREEVDAVRERVMGRLERLAPDGEEG